MCALTVNYNIILDPAYQERVPLLDGGEGSNELVLYGTNVDWKGNKETEPVDNDHTEEQSATNTTGNDEDTANTTGNDEDNYYQ